MLIVKARERRDGLNKDYDEQAELQSTTADYRAVAPDAKMSVSLLLSVIELPVKVLIAVGFVICGVKLGGKSVDNFIVSCCQADVAGNEIYIHWLNHELCIINMFMFIHGLCGLLGCNSRPLCFLAGCRKRRLKGGSALFFVFVFLCILDVCVVLHLCFLVVSTSAISGLERLISEIIIIIIIIISRLLKKVDKRNHNTNEKKMTCYVSCGTLNPTH